MTDTDNAQLISVDDAARLLGKSQRTVYRYAEQGRLTVHDTPAGKLFERRAVEALAAELNVVPQPIQPAAELVPLSDMLSELHRKDDEIRAANERLQAAAHENGRLRERLEIQQKALTDADMTRQRLTAAEAERDRLKVELEQVRAELEASKQPEPEPEPPAEPPQQPAAEPTTRRPWWRRLFSEI